MKAVSGKNFKTFHVEISLKVKFLAFFFLIDAEQPSPKLRYSLRSVRRKN